MSSPLLVPTSGELTIGRKASCNVVIGSPLISNVHCTVLSTMGRELVQVTVLDQSRNGTWVCKKKNHLPGESPSKKVTRVSKDLPCLLDVGDVIYLLHPRHTESLKFRLKLGKVKDKGLCLFHLSCDGDAEKASHKRGLENPDLPSSKVFKGEKDSGHGVSICLERESDSMVKMCLTGEGVPPLPELPSSTASVDEGNRVAVNNKGKEDEKLCHSCGVRMDIGVLSTYCPDCSKDEGELALTDKDDRGKADSPEEEGDAKSIGVIYSSLSLEQCPSCLELFPVLDLVSHHGECVGLRSRMSSSLSERSGGGEESMEDDEEVGECPYCSKAFPIEELVLHCQECGRKGSSSPVLPVWSAHIPTSSHIDTDCDGPGDRERSRLHGSGNDSEDFVHILREEPERESATADEASFIGVTPSVGAAANDCPPANVLRVASVSEGSVTDASKEGGAGSGGSMQELELCENCLKEFPLHDLLAHHATCTENNKSLKKSGVREQCQHCLKDFPLDEIIGHANNCSERVTEESFEIGSEGVVGGEEVWGEPVERCMHCFKDFPLSKIVRHSNKCKEELLGNKDRFKSFLPSVHDMDAMTLTVLTDAQREAVEYVTERSKRESMKVYKSLRDRVISLGFSEEDLTRTLQWIRREAPIIIHVDLTRALHFLVKDTHYRNLFETGTGSGSLSTSSRVLWEDNIFNKIYSRHGASPFERVKYGVLNIVGDPHGVRCCYSYGDSFLQLKKVRLRTTFASQDTSNASVVVSCCEHYGNVLHEYSEPELKSIIEVSTGRKPFLKSDIIRVYKEVQIHGPVCLSENVECVVVNERHRNDTHIKGLLEEFVRRNSCNVIWMDNVDYPP